MRLKICQIIPTLVQGGAEKQMSLLASQLDPERFDSHVIVLTHSGYYEQLLRDRGVQVHVIGKRGKLDPSAYSRLSRKLAEIRPHVVHSWLFAANSYGRFAAQRQKVPVVIAGERSVDPWKQRWHFAIDRLLLKRTDRLVTNTSAVVEFYARHGIPADRFTVIPNGVTVPDVQRLSRAETLQRLGLEPRSALIGAVGRLWKQKGYRDLIWAGELLRIAFPDVWVVIIGDGPDRESLLAFRDKTQSYPAVRLVGHRPDAAELMTGFDALWNGSLYEGQSNTILEAMAFGIPVLATDIPGTRDLVTPETGYLYPTGDSGTLTRLTNHLLRDAALRQSMGGAAQARIAAEFSVEKMVRSHESLYTQLYRTKCTIPAVEE